MRMLDLFLFQILFLSFKMFRSYRTFSDLVVNTKHMVVKYIDLVPQWLGLAKLKQLLGCGNGELPSWLKDKLTVWDCESLYTVLVLAVLCHTSSTFATVKKLLLFAHILEVGGSPVDILVRCCWYNVRRGSKADKHQLIWVGCFLMMYLVCCSPWQVQNGKQKLMILKLCG